jgi:fatty acid desaturase
MDEHDWEQELREADAERRADNRRALVIHVRALIIAAVLGGLVAWLLLWMIPTSDLVVDDTATWHQAMDSLDTSPPTTVLDYCDPECP